jgi:hypothetical protein
LAFEGEAAPKKNTKDTKQRKHGIPPIPTPPLGTEVTQKRDLGRQPVKPAIYMKYTISEDMSQCTEAQEKTRLIAVHDRLSPFISKRCGLPPNSADRVRKNSVVILNSAIQTGEFNGQPEQQQSDRKQHFDEHWPRAHTRMVPTVSTTPFGHKGRRSLYEEDIKMQRLNARSYTVEVREPNRRDLRMHRSSGYYQ